MCTLFPAGLQLATTGRLGQENEVAVCGQERPTGPFCQGMRQQPLLRTLDGLTVLTGEEKYRRAAEEATR